MSKSPAWGDKRDEQRLAFGKKQLDKWDREEARSYRRNLICRLCECLYGTFKTEKEDSGLCPWCWCKEVDAGRIRTKGVSVEESRQAPQRDIVQRKQIKGKSVEVLSCGHIFKGSKLKYQYNKEPAKMRRCLECLKKEREKEEQP